MKKYIAGWIVLKLGLLALFWMLAFSSCETLGITSAGRAVLPPDPTPTPVDDSIDRPTSDPFKGDLTRFEREDRAEKLQIGKVMDLLGITKGSRVGDIGAGSGWFTMIASERVGDSGRVFAVDISQDAVTFINDRIAKDKTVNVETVLGEPDDPLLSGKGLDAVLILNTYHEIAEPVTFLRNLRESLKDGALLGIIDRDGTGGDHGVGKDVVIAEAARAGFRFVEEHDFVKADRMDYFLIFKTPGK